MKVTIFGSGYVGLVTGACLSHVGHDVVCVDINPEKVEQLNRGVSPIFEPGLEEFLKEGLREQRLQFTTDIAKAVAHGEVQFIAVGTPADEDGSADIRYVLEVGKSIGQHLNHPAVVVTKSTVPVGTSDRVHNAVATALQARGVKPAFAVASNPEFLKEGAAINDFMKPDRIVVGTDSEWVERIMRELYAPFNRNHERLMVMDIRSAELTKYAANAMLATKISFINEIANIAEQVGADIEHVRQGIGSDPRIGYHFIYPGCGYGGSCFPKDTRALEATALQAGYRPSLLQAVGQVNDRQKRRLFEKISRYFDGNLEGKIIAVWGLSFKPNTDDMREAPSRDLMERLWRCGAKVQAFDPHAMEECQRIYGDRNDLVLTGTKEAAIRDADALVICTEWKNFWAPDFELLREQLKNQVIFDGRNLYDPEKMQELGFEYIGVGRSSKQEKPLAVSQVA
ncbi:UDP-glucose/GDP-mannose dehydrogenase family protein [Porticoccaceae bacterium LTM1]|nr:UDP-glucose/GDP-mannose dehydrogenase family protein [Porticoccaceae bacterium LTM1]